MSRYAFTPNKEYAGRVHAVWKKSVENTQLSLIRVEFEIFECVDVRHLKAIDKFACRDVVVGSKNGINLDKGVAPYISALGIRRPELVGHWLRLTGLWVKIIFGAVSEREQRNEIRQITSINVTHYEIQELNYGKSAKWVSVGEAARKMRCSESTIRRSLVPLEEEFGEQLVRRTSGGHRRINFDLFKHLFRQERGG